MACVSGSIEVVQKLVQGGADTTAEDAAQETPFHEACRHQFESIVVRMLCFFFSVLFSVFPYSRQQSHTPTGFRFAGVFIEAGFLWNFIRGGVGRGLAAFVWFVGRQIGSLSIR